MELRLTEGPVGVLEGPAHAPLMRRVDDVAEIVEQCLSSRVGALLLYEPNLTERFFDLSSGEAGEILAKLFQYRVRVAIVGPAGDTGLGERFRELLREEGRRGRFRLFDSAEPARAWVREL